MASSALLTNNEHVTENFPNVLEIRLVKLNITKILFCWLPGLCIEKYIIGNEIHFNDSYFELFNANFKNPIYPTQCLNLSQDGDVSVQLGNKKSRFGLDKAKTL